MLQGWSPFTEPLMRLVIVSYENESQKASFSSMRHLPGKVSSSVPGMFGKALDMSMQPQKAAMWTKANRALET